MGRRVPSLVSVIMPVRNADDHVGEQLDALADQKYDGDWEVVVVDNGCTDESMEVVRRFGGRVPSLRIVDASRRRGLAHARNAGAGSARGDLLAFCDADDVVTPGWLEAMVRAAPGAAIVGGALELEALNEGAPRQWCDWDPPDDLSRHHDFLPYVSGGNCGVWTTVARELGWDESFLFGSTDMEFCWRAQLAGHELGFAADAVVHQRFRQRLTSLVRQFYAYGKSDAQLFRRFQPEGMPRPAPTESGGWRWIVRRSPDVLRGTARRGRWMRTVARATGRLVGSLRHRVFAP